MLRFLGCLCIFFGTCFWGWSASAGEKMRVLFLRDMIDGLEKLNRELAFHLTPLPQLFLMIGKELSGPAGAFFLACGESAEKGEESLWEIWERELQNLREQMSTETADVLLRFGRFLGRSEWMEEREHLAAVKSQLQEILNREREEMLRHGKLYRTLSPAAGGILILLLL